MKRAYLPTNPFLIAILGMATILLFRCGSEDNGPNGQESDEFAICNDLIGEGCPGNASVYCLFGYKWGEQGTFESIGDRGSGPASTGGTVTYSFQEMAGTINTHREVNVPTFSFDLLDDCAKEQIEKAFESWETIADINFQKEPDDTNSDIRLYVAGTIQTGIAFPAFQGGKCQELAGQLTINPNHRFDCEEFYLFVLHEIGHTLGLGHVTTADIMNGSSNVILSLDGIQQGDSLGLIEIYGPKTD